ncbi:MAG: endonuclease dU [Promethearchaeota archaeon]
MGVDDGPFSTGTRTPGRPSRAVLVGVLMKGLQLVDILFGSVEVDGTDATEQVIQIVQGSSHEAEIRYVVTDGVTFGGFNVLDVAALRERTRKKVVTLTDTPPDVEAMKRALLKVFPDGRERVEVLERALPVHGVVSNPDLTPKKVYVHYEGISEQEGLELVRKTCVYSATPEPLRIAHLVARRVALIADLGN